MAVQPPSQPYQLTFLRVMWATLVLVFVALSFWLLIKFYQVLFILFIAIVIGTVIRPTVAWLHRRGLPRIAGVILVYVLMLALLTGFVLSLFPLIIEQGTTIVASVPGYYQSLCEWMLSESNQLIMSLGEFLPEKLTGLAMIEPIGEDVLASAGQALDYVGVAAKIIFMVTAVLLLALHWTLDGPRTIQTLLIMVPKSHRENLRELISAIERKVGFYIVGQGVLCLVVGLLALVAYLLIGLPNALLLAIVVGLLEAVPMIGALLGALPAAVITLSIAPSKLV